MKDKHEPKISLEEYIKKARTFRIPDYQRGYIWGQSCRYGMERKADSVNFMLDTLLSAFEEYLFTKIIKMVYLLLLTDSKEPPYYFCF